MRSGWMVVAAAILVVMARVLPAPWRFVVGEEYVDGFGTQWFFWFAGEALAGREAWGHSTLMYFPWGKDVYAHTGGNLVDAGLAWPLRVGFGPVLGYNLWVATVLGTNAWAGGRVARVMGAERAWIGGLVLVLNPYVLTELAQGRPTQAWLCFPALAVAALWRMGSWREAVLAGVAIGLSGLTYWYYGLMLGVLAALDGPRRLGLRVLAGVVALGLTLPFALPMLRALDAGGVPGLLALDGEGILAPLALRTVEGDAEGLYIFSLLRGVAGSLVDEGGLRFIPAGAPLLWVLLPVLFWARSLRLAAWVAVAVLIASGPAFVIGEHFVRNPVFLTLAEASDLVRRWWWPGRAVFVLPILLCGAVAALPRWGLALVAVGAVAQLRGDVVLPRWSAEPPAAVARIAGLEGAVIDLPLLTDQKNLWYQTVHGRPVLGGMLMKKPAFGSGKVTELRERNSFLDALLRVGEREWTSDLDYREEDRAALVEMGFSWVLVRGEWFRRPVSDRDGVVRWEPEWSRPRRLLDAVIGEAPLVDDGKVAVWALGPTPRSPPP